MANRFSDSIPYIDFQKEMVEQLDNQHSRPLIPKSPNSSTPVFHGGLEEVDAKASFAPGTGSPLRSRSNTLELPYKSGTRNRNAGSGTSFEREGEDDIERGRKRNVSGKTDNVDATSEVPEIRGNMYQAKKTVAQGLLDIALLTANASQLKNLIETENHPHYELAMTLLCISIVLQIVVAILLLVVGRMDFETGSETRKKESKSAILLNDISTIGVFLITTVNIFIASFISHGKAYIPNVNAQESWNEKIYKEQRFLWEESGDFRRGNLTPSK